jgi:tRNA nucleotidyltransferase/poly(A) polymerase
MSGLAFLVQPFAAVTAPSPACFSPSSFLGNPVSLLGADSVASIKTLAARRLACTAQFERRQFSSSDSLLAGAAAAAAGSNNRDSPSSSSSSSSSSSPPKTPRKTASRRRKSKFANNDYVEAAAAAADLLDLDLITKQNSTNIVEKTKEHHKFLFEHIEPQPRTNDSDSLPPPLVLQDDAHPIREHLISGAAWTVLLRLLASGHQAYIVGGTVRDMLLKKIPKDYDILTSAEPSEIESLFPRAFLLGRSFPICHVHHDNEVIEVSSFSTNADPSRIPLDVAAMMTLSKRETGRRSSSSSRVVRGGKKGRISKKAIIESDNNGVLIHKDDGGGGNGSGWGLSVLEEEIDDDDDIEILSSSLMKSEGPTWATARRDNATKRDFRVNGLLYDPFSRILYDYVGGTADCTAKILRTMGSPTHSFTQDPARILRAVRLAARVGLNIEKESSDSMMKMAMMTAKLPQGRLQMELAAMFTHGAALPALKLLWKYGLLDILLPHHAVMLSKQQIPREGKSEKNSVNETDGGDISVSASSNASPTSSQVLFALLAELDKTASSCKPAETSVWVTAIAAPLVAQECQRAVERWTATKLRQQRQRDAEDEEERSSSSSSNEWYDVHDIDALLPSRKSTLIKNNGVAARATRKSGRKKEKKEEEEILAVDSVPCIFLPEQLEIYGKIVDKVMAKLLSKPDAKTQKHLAKIAPLAVRLNGAGGVKKKIKKIDTDNHESALSSTSTNGISDSGTLDDSTNMASNSTDSASPAVPVLSCVLPRQAVEAARSFLKLEALLRGQELPELHATSFDKKRGGSSGGGKNRSGAQQPKHIGRSKKGRGRKLAANEDLVLQLLRAPSVQWAQATQLGIYDEEDLKLYE